MSRPAPTLMIGDVCAAVHNNGFQRTIRHVGTLQRFDARGFAIFPGGPFKRTDHRYGSNEWRCTTDSKTTLQPASDADIDEWNANLRRAAIGSIGRQESEYGRPVLTDAQVSAIYDAAVGCGAVQPVALIVRVGDV